MKSNVSTPFKPFAVEQFLSESEHGVVYNFSESGVHPLSFSELFALTQMDTETLFATLVDYPQVNGLEALRERIAAMYPGADADNVLVTVGATEANTLVAAALLEGNDNLVRFRPTYEQLSGNAANLGFEVRQVDLVEEDNWSIDETQLHALTDDQTRVIHVVNPNNPTGCILSNADRRTIVECAQTHNAWVVADEVYIGTERNTDTPTRSMWGEANNVIIINSMSKAYGLPGLRLGWVVAPHQVMDSLWRRHEYASIATSMFSMKVAEAALSPASHARLTERARGLIRRGFDTLTAALKVHPGVFSVVPPQASAMSFVKFDLPVGSDELAARLLNDEDVLVIPGSKFGLEGHFRFSSALPDAHLSEGLDRFNRVIGHILQR